MIKKNFNVLLHLIFFLFKCEKFFMLVNILPLLHTFYLYQSTI